VSSELTVIVPLIVDTSEAVAAADIVGRELPVISELTVLVPLMDERLEGVKADVPVAAPLIVDRLEADELLVPDSEGAEVPTLVLLIVDRLEAVAAVDTLARELPVASPVIVDRLEGVELAEPVADGLLLPVSEGAGPLVVVPLIVDSPEAVATDEPVSIEVPLRTGVPVATPLIDEWLEPVELAEEVAEPLAEELVVLDTEAEEVSTLVPLIVDSPEGVATDEPLSIELTLGTDVSVAAPLIVDVPEGLTLDEILLEALPETVPLIDGSLELLAVAEAVALAVPESLLTELIDGTEVSVAVPLMVDTLDSVEVPDELLEAVAEADELPEPLELLDSMLEAVALLAPVLEADPEADEVPDPLPLTDGLTEEVTVLVPLEEALPDMVAVAEPVPLMVATLETVALPTDDSELVTDELPDSENRADGLAAALKLQGLLADSDKLAEAETLADPDSPVLADPDPELETLQLNSPLVLPDAENQADGELLNELLVLAEGLLVALTVELETPELLKLRRELRDTAADRESLAHTLEDRVPMTERVPETLTVPVKEGRTEPLELTLSPFDTDTEADTEPD
jgi:hypothetical protein